MAIVQDGPAANLRKRKSLNPTTAADGPAEGQEDIADGKTNAGGIASGESLAVLRPGGIPTEHGQEIDRQMDEHEEYEFGGPVGTTAMMVIFPVLMCEFYCKLQTCSVIARSGRSIRDKSGY
jgi:delta24(24(1))-sterol reductase